MKAFRFRASALLDLRHRQRDVARAVLARATGAARETETALGRADARTSEAMARYGEALAETGEAGALERHRIWMASQQSAADACRRTHAERVLAVDGAATALQDAHRQVRMLERLRDRMSARHAEAVRRQDMKEIDELATLRHATRVMQGGLDRER